MAALSIYLQGEGALQDIPRDRIAEGDPHQPLRVMALEGGMVSGAPSVGIAIPLPHGGVVLGQVSLKLFLTAADALRARYGDPR